MTITIGLGPWMVPATATIAVWAWVIVGGVLDVEDDFGYHGFGRFIGAIFGTLSAWCLFFALGYYGVFK